VATTAGGRNPGAGGGAVGGRSCRRRSAGGRALDGAERCCPDRPRRWCYHPSCGRSPPGACRATCCLQLALASRGKRPRGGPAVRASAARNRRGAVTGVSRGAAA